MIAVGKWVHIAATLTLSLGLLVSCAPEERNTVVKPSAPATTSPGAATTPATAATTPKTCTIVITADGKTMIAGKEFSDAELRAYLTAAVKANDNLSVTIQADERAAMKYFAPVAKICMDVKVKEAKLVYLSVKE
ncbi:MAG TPA: biopolymer transporter ExbD [Tepidisphaeraceae bacterium]|jgi:biopolymer transport protein ExbD|nr:biopolymer transporter ExbD [Tepidisphaeraceae bacterium]